MGGPWVVQIPPGWDLRGTVMFGGCCCRVGSNVRKKEIVPALNYVFSREKNPYSIQTPSTSQSESLSIGISGAWTYRTNRLILFRPLSCDM